MRAVHTDRPLLIFADGGVNEYSYDLRSTASDGSRVTSVRCVQPSALFPADGPLGPRRIVEALRRAGIPLAHIEVRGNAVIAVKPVDEYCRRPLLCLIKHIIAGSDLVVRERGKTTVEICKSSVSKVYALEQVCSHSSMSSRITYIGDEFESGNDHDVGKLAACGSRMTCLHVDGPAKTAFFLSTLIAHLTSNVRR